MTGWGESWREAGQAAWGKARRAALRYATERYRVAGALFLRALGLTYLVAFGSLLPQISGLIGPRGVLPADRFLRAVEHRFGGWAILELPTLAWLSQANWFLWLLGLAGAGAGAAMALGRGRWPVVAAAWALWLSLVLVGGEFTAYQWEALLLEAGFLAIFLALFSSEGRRSPAPAVTFLLRWLLFRLVFSSGVAKIASGDATWSSLSALLFHFETQPLPTPLGWLAHQLPEPILRLACLGVLGLEIAVPPMVLLPQPWPRRAFWPLVGLQAVIALTGNYAYFNWLCAALCLFCLDDAWPWSPGAARLAGREATDRLPPAPAWKRRLGAASAGLLAVLGAYRVGQACGLAGAVPPWPLREPLRWANRFHLVSSYGLFTVMTTVRHEIVIEGSRDGTRWEPYLFSWKPGLASKWPLWIAPHQPRLDWQAWFAALSSFEEEPWLGNLMTRLLEGEPAVAGLFARNPFPDSPPRFVRARLVRYRFTRPAELALRGEWWIVESERDFSPILTLGAEEP